MNCFKSFLALFCAFLLASSLSTLTFAQGPPDSLARDAKTWHTLNAIESGFAKIRELAVDAGNTKNPKQAARDQAAYLKTWPLLQTDCESFGYADLYASVGIGRDSGVSSLMFTGTIQGVPMFNNAEVFLTITTPATPAQIKVQFQLPPDGLVAPILHAGVIQINGFKIYATTSDTYQSLLNKIFNAFYQNDLTGRGDPITPDGIVNFTMQRFTTGSQFGIRLQDPTGLLNGPPLTIAYGSDAMGTLTLDDYYAFPPVAPQTTTLFGGSQPGDSGQMLRDDDGNLVVLTDAGDVITNNLFIGGEYYIHLNLADFGADTIQGSNITTLDVTTAAGATNAIIIIDWSHTQIGQIKQQFLQNHPKFHP